MKQGTLEDVRSRCSDSPGSLVRALCARRVRFVVIASVLFLAASIGGHAAQTNLPVRGLCIAAPSAAHLDTFLTFIRQELAPREVNTLILRVDYNYQFQSRPELADPRGLSKADVKKLVEACRGHQIHLIPQINLLGHQSWANHNGTLLRVHPEFDETPWVKMPEKYAWPNPDKLYCRSYCPLHPQVHAVVFDVVDEICDAFEADAFHAGMDEVFYIGEEKCPRCANKDRGELFAGEVKAIEAHLKEKGRTLWIWGDRLLDGKTTGLGEWEASMNGTSGAINLVPKDVVICDWHYDRAEPTGIYFALSGFPVVTCPWKNSRTATLQTEDVFRARMESAPVVRDHLLGILQTVWSGAEGFLAEMAKLKENPDYKRGEPSEARCFNTTFETIRSQSALLSTQSKSKTSSP